MKTKACPQCKQKKSVSEFGKDKNRKDGHYPVCKECKNKKARQDYQKPDIWQQKAEYRKRYNSDPIKHSEQIQRQRQWYAEHWQDPEFRKAERERSKIYDKSMAGKERHSRYRKSEKSHAYQREYRKTHFKIRYNNDPKYRAKVREWFTIRNNKKRSNGGSLTTEEWVALVKAADGMCLSCGRSIKLTVDHIIPVIAGGKTELDNIQPLCDRCNKSKGINTIDYRDADFLSRTQMYLNETIR